MYNMSSTNVMAVLYHFSNSMHVESKQHPGLDLVLLIQQVDAITEGYQGISDGTPRDVKGPNTNYFNYKWQAILSKNFG